MHIINMILSFLEFQPTRKPFSGIHGANTFHVSYKSTSAFSLHLNTYLVHNRNIVVDRGLATITEGDIGVCGIAVLGNFSCGISVILI